jgi:hypothetical protein
VSFSYDANDNLLTPDGTRTFAYDAENELRSTRKAGIVWRLCRSRAWTGLKCLHCAF